MSKDPKVVTFDRSAAYLHHRAMMNRRDNHHVDALELMRRAVEAQPENSEYRLDLAELYCEMGCHRQSSRLLLDMLSEKDAPSECFYGLALNQLGMNDINGARNSLSLYRRRDPEGAHLEEVRALASELDMFNALSHPASRKLYRAGCVANRACEALKADEPAKKTAKKETVKKEAAKKPAAKKEAKEEKAEEAAEEKKPARRTAAKKKAEKTEEENA